MLHMQLGHFMPLCLQDSVDMGEEIHYYHGYLCMPSLYTTTGNSACLPSRYATTGACLCMPSRCFSGQCVGMYRRGVSYL